MFLLIREKETKCVSNVFYYDYVSMSLKFNGSFQLRYVTLCDCGVANGLRRWLLS